ncbi:hypothetical protein [Desulfonema magnum]|uniref:hypothetical protein n=1 Tax=Desulfonema magnum TaxID=45655 RepID=UPI001A9C18A9|nr:hypothetical protein [Desulfonema magnum]
MRNEQGDDMDVGTGCGFCGYAGYVGGSETDVGGTGGADGRILLRRHTGKITEQAGAECRGFGTSGCSEA